MTLLPRFLRFLQIRPNRAGSVVEAAPADIVAPEPVVVQEAPEPVLPPLAFRLVAHLAGIGDRTAAEDGWAGLGTAANRIEGFAAACDAPGWSEQVTFQAVQADGALGAHVPGGGFCGTHGKSTPLHGFVVHVPEEAARFAGIFYQGVFEDGFHSGLLSPGSLCVSPQNAPLLAMRITTDPDAAAAPHAMTPPEAAPALMDKAVSSVSLIAHIADQGDTACGEDGWAGEPGSTKAIEGFAAAHSMPGWQLLTCRAVLADGSLDAGVQAGGYCGTHSKSQPLYGFVLETGEDANSLEGITYEGAFQDGFRSPVLVPGQICISPAKAPLVAMRIVAGPRSEPAADLAAENIRLVIWDLDETFWDGTLTEGGIVWREDHARIVRTLASRGIISSICSKNDEADVLRVLDQHGLRDHFVFTSISWEAKGPRLAALIEAIQLRAASVLFIDDNALNRAEALRFVPELNVADEHVVAGLLDHPRLQGKPDPGLSRLAQYQVLARRHVDLSQASGDAASFLRESGIVVTLEHDIEQHVDRAVELINRTNQLNFTKQRLPDNPDDPSIARDALRRALAGHEVQAALVHVRDNYGDYGYAGFYMRRQRAVGGPELLHFTFSCRILGMGVETWLYRALGRPQLTVSGKVISDPVGDDRVIDWINAGTQSTDSEKSVQKPGLSYAMLRGACDLRPLAHYLSLSAVRVIEELDTHRIGQWPLLNHSVIAAQSMVGFDAELIRDAAPLGYIEEDFKPLLSGPVPEGRAVWVFGFAIEHLAPMFRHRATGTVLPWSAVGLTGTVDEMMAGGDIGNADPAVVAHLRAKFEYIGRRANEEVDSIFRESLRAILSRATDEVSVFIVLGGERRVTPDGREAVAHHMRSFNLFIREIVAEFPSVHLLEPLSFLTPAEIAPMREPNHFDRIAYYRMFKHITSTISSQPDPQARSDTFVQA
jgi:FkbH-like protein